MDLRVTGGRMPTDQFHRIQRALEAAADRFTRPVVAAPGDESSLESRLLQVTRAALDMVPGADCAGLTMQDGDGRLSSHGQTSPAVKALDQLQVVLGEGPCLEAVRRGAPAVIEVHDYMLEAERWSRFAPEAVGHGLRSSLSFAMAPQGATPGAVNIYSRTTRAFDETAKAIAGAFAMQAAIVVYGAQNAAGLELALKSRDVIGQAKGILMERYRIDGNEAFHRLVRASQDTNTKLFDVARWLTEDVTLPAEPAVFIADDPPA